MKIEFNQTYVPPPGFHVGATPLDEDGAQVCINNYLIAAKYAEVAAKERLPEGWNIRYYKPDEFVEDFKTLVISTPSADTLNKDSVEHFTAELLVNYPDNSQDKSSVEIFLDTDGDGFPDTEDEDDDNDGFLDIEEVNAECNPKRSNATLICKPVPDPETPILQEVALSYAPRSMQLGATVSSAPQLRTQADSSYTAPDGTTYALANNFVEPVGYKVSIDSITGIVTVSAPAEATPSTARSIDVPVVATLPEGTASNQFALGTAHFQLEETPVEPKRPSLPWWLIVPAAGVAGSTGGSSHTAPHTTAAPTMSALPHSQPTVQQKATVRAQRQLANTGITQVHGTLFAALIAVVTGALLVWGRRNANAVASREYTS